MLPVALCVSVQAGGKSILELAEASRKMQDFRGGQHGNGLTRYGLKYVCVYTVYICIPVVPHKAVAEVSKIGNL